MKTNNIYNIDFNLGFQEIDDNSIDLIITDPPYEIGISDGQSKKPLKKLMNDTPDSINWQYFFEQCYRVLNNRKMLFIHCRLDMILRISQYINESNFKYCHDFIWLKGDMGYGNLNVMGTTHELLIALSKGSAEKSRPLFIDQEIKKRVPAIYYGKTTTKEYWEHPTQKPVGLSSYIILNRTDEGDTILDPFCGVSSSLIAAKVLKRNYIGFEIDKHFYDLSLKRLKDEKHIQMYEKMIESGLIREKGAIKYKL
jgi:site-specific DNA-methyltransferase (adenine-specific)